MGRVSKWLTDVKHDQPAADVVHRAVADRLKMVRDYLPRAAERFEDDLEYVHQLRVWTRRSTAALDAFGEHLPKRRTRRLKKRLKQLRRAAAKARDLDVLEQSVRAIAAEESGDDLEPVLELIARRRIKAQRPLVMIHDKLGHNFQAQNAKAFVRRVRWRGDGPAPQFADVAWSSLLARADDFFAAATADLTHIEAIHRMRILGKKLRYAMELFAGVFDADFREQLYPEFAEVQEKLGRINDHATAYDLFSAWTAEEQGERCAQLALMQQYQVDLQAAQFRKWWTSDRAKDVQARFRDALVSTHRTSSSISADVIKIG